VGQLGNGTTKNSATPTLVDGVAGATVLALGEQHSCAITSDSSLECWGQNKLGQLGAGSQASQSIYPIPVRSPSEWGKPTAIASGKNHSCAIYGQGILACWGFNQFGQLGTGYEAEGLFNNAPTQVLRDVGAAKAFIKNAQQVVAGEAHTCVLAAGKVECWGENTLGELGEDPDSVPTRPYARPVPGLEELVIDELAASAAHTCARAGTDVYCWGDNFYGELANDEGWFGGPTHIALPAETISIATGRSFACALGKDGKARCWGANEEGQLGVPVKTSNVPVEIPLPNVAGIYGGDGRHACALKDDASAWCWGRNDYGQLGNNEISDKQPAPKRVSALSASLGCRAAGTDAN